MQDSVLYVTDSVFTCCGWGLATITMTRISTLVTPLCLVGTFSCLCHYLLYITTRYGLSKQTRMEVFSLTSSLEMLFNFMSPRIKTPTTMAAL
jgi:hypothetical protein